MEQLTKRVEERLFLVDTGSPGTFLRQDTLHSLGCVPDEKCLHTFFSKLSVWLSQQTHIIWPDLFLKESLIVYYYDIT